MDRPVSFSGIGVDFGAVADVLPGSHRVLVRSNMGMTVTTLWQAEAGKTYRMEARAVGACLQGASNKVRPVFVPAPPLVAKKLRKMFP